MANVCRLLDTNLVKQAGATLTPSSVYSSFPVRHLLDQIRSKVWRSALGWVFSAENDKFEFNRGGIKTATITHGTYATGSDVATALQAALEVADSTPVWAVSYSTSTFKFTIASDLAFIILSGTGSLLAQSLLKDLGYAVGSDTASATSHVAGSTSYQSRHCIEINLVTAQALNPGAAFILDHNLSDTGTVKFLASETAMTGNGYDTGSGGSGIEQTLSGNSELRIAYVNGGGTTFGFLRFVLQDVQNSVGYAEIGIAYAGSYRQPTHGYSDEFDEGGADLSVVETATEGANYGDLRPESPSWILRWRNLESADADILRAHRTAAPQGKCFGLAFDADVDNTDFSYGYRLGELPITTSGSGGLLWVASMTFFEALP